MATAASVLELKQFIGGEWAPAASGATYEDRDPYTGEVVATAPAGSPDDAAKAVETAAASAAAWAAAPPVERQRIFLKAADLLEERRDEVVSMLARETGATFGFGMFQSFFVPNLFRQAAALAYAPMGQVIPSDTGAFAMGLRKPAGVVGAFAPWNAALILSARSIAAPLALGNTVVLKPSEWSPWSGGLLWGEIFEEAGLPAGALNIVTHAPGDAGPVGAVDHRAPRRPPPQLHGVERGRAADRRGRRAPAQAGRARARRLQPADRPRRRRPRLRGQRDRVRLLPAPGADLHVHAPDRGRAFDRRRVRRAARREDQGPEDRRPEGARHRHRAADQRGRARDGQGPRRAGRRRRGDGAHGRGCRRALLPGDAAHRRPRGVGVREARDVRPGRLDRGGRRRRRGRGSARMPPRTG